MGHGRAGAARFTGTRAITSPRFVAAASRGGLHGRTWAPWARPRRRPLDARRARTADQLVTRSTYRLLLMKGLAPDEAANLTAFLCGIPVADVHWSLRQVNQLLFLRELARTGRFGPADGEAPRPH